MPEKYMQSIRVVQLNAGNLAAGPSVIFEQRINSGYQVRIRPALIIDPSAL